MNRKLHNSLTAVVASSALMLVGLLVAVPVRPALEPVLIEAVASTDIDASLDPLPAGTEEAPATPRRHMRARQSVRMPFFSFVPRG